MSFAIGFHLNSVFTQKPFNDNKEKTKSEKQQNMKLGAFPVCLSVKDIKSSKEYYEKLGFNAFAGSMAQNYQIMKNDNARIGLFQGMFQGNIFLR